MRDAKAKELVQSAERKAIKVGHAEAKKLAQSAEWEAIGTFHG